MDGDMYGGTCREDDRRLCRMLGTIRDWYWSWNTSGSGLISAGSILVWPVISIQLYNCY